MKACNMWASHDQAHKKMAWKWHEIRPVVGLHIKADWCAGRVKALNHSWL